MTITDLTSREECEKIRDDVGELSRLADGRTTTRSKITSYTVQGKELWLFGIRALTDAELARKDAKKAHKEEFKDAVPNDVLLKIVGTINK